MLKTAYLALGSNVGDREKLIRKAVDILNAHEGIEVEAVSNLIETKAVASSPQPDFLNGAMRIKTILTPRELLEFTQSVEKKLGRDSKGTGDPRKIDIDILFYGDEIVSEDDLMIPHPMIQERGFVLLPLKDIAPDFVHPVLQKTVAELAKKFVGY